MKKIITHVSVFVLTAISMSVLPKSEDIQSRMVINSAIDNVQDMREWMTVDIDQGMVVEQFGEYYLQWLDDTEKILINYASINNLTYNI